MATMSAGLGEIYSTFSESYGKTPKRLRLIDVFLVWSFLTGVIQFVYVCQVGTYPFNAFLAGFLSTVGTFVLFGGWFSHCVARTIAVMARLRMVRD